ncbi:hypothetical protein V6N11_072177 [Hibiscus sabdariffa]|uniref:Uncharacterized protein n=1 Tax=Hibiscus sabdariffa TaxID=183260 RepID=A0ABR2U2K7_9ROSI
MQTTSILTMLVIVGGLALWWNDEVSITIHSAGRNLIDISTTFENEEHSFCSFVYGPPQKEDKKEFWESMTNIIIDLNNQWCIIDDSNIVAKQGKKDGGNLVDHLQANWFNNLLDICGIMDMPIQGGDFTWLNQRVEDDEIQEKINGILVNSNRNNRFCNAIGVMEPTIGSYHSPIVCLFKGLSREKKKL